MSFLRRGYVPAGIPLDAKILLHRLDGYRQKIEANEISCFEEHLLDLAPRAFVFVYLMNQTQVAIQDTFEEFADLLFGEAVSFEA